MKFLVKTCFYVKMCDAGRFPSITLNNEDQELHADQKGA